MYSTRTFSRRLSDNTWCPTFSTIGSTVFKSGDEYKIYVCRGGKGDKFGNIVPKQNMSIDNTRQDMTCCYVAIGARICLGLDMVYYC